MGCFPETYPKGNKRIGTPTDMFVYILRASYTEALQPSLPGSLSCVLSLPKNLVQRMSQVNYSAQTLLLHVLST